MDYPLYVEGKVVSPDPDDHTPIIGYKAPEGTVYVSRGNYWVRVRVAGVTSETMLRRKLEGFDVKAEYEKRIESER